MAERVAGRDGVEDLYARSEGEECVLKRPRRGLNPGADSALFGGEYVFFEKLVMHNLLNILTKLSKGVKSGWQIADRNGHLRYGFTGFTHSLQYANGGTIAHDLKRI